MPPGARTEPPCGNTSDEALIQSAEVPLLFDSQQSEDEEEEAQEREVEREAGRYGFPVPQLGVIWVYSFLKWFKPSEAFLVEYMVRKGFTNSQVYNTIFPLWVYSHLPALFLVGILSEAIGCKPVVVLGSFLGVLTTALTLGAPPGGLGMLQASQLTIAFSWSSHSAFSALAFACVPRSRYQMMTHGNRGATLLGSCLSALLGQLLRPYVGLDWLFRISLIGQLLTFGTAFLLRSPPSDTDSNADTCPPEGRPTGAPSRAEPQPSKVEVHLVKAHLVQGAALLDRGLLFLNSVGLDLWAAMAVPGVRTWTCWALIGESVHRMVFTYWQNLVKAVVGPSSASGSNGTFYAVMYMLAAGTTVATATLPLGRLRLLIQSLSPAVCGLLLMLAARGPLGSTYTGLLLYQCVHEVTAATCATQVGTEMKLAYATTTSRAIHSSTIRQRQLPLSSVPPERRLAVLFSTTAAVSVVIESIIQSGLLALSLKIQQRFQVLGLLLLLLACLLPLPAFVSWAGTQLKAHRLNLSIMYNGTDDVSIVQHSVETARKSDGLAKVSTPLLA